MFGLNTPIKRGEVLTRNGDILYYNNTPICVYRSLNGKMHFAPNDDNNGLKRGDLTYAIAYSDRIRYSEDDRQQRFTDEELDILNTKYEKYIKPDIDVLLFNDDFFEESIETLQEIANSVNITPEGDKNV